MDKIIFKYINLKEFVTYNELHKIFGLPYNQICSIFKHRFLQVNEKEFIIYDKDNNTIFTKNEYDWKHYFYKENGLLDHVEYSEFITYSTAAGQNSYAFGVDTASTGESTTMYLKYNDGKYEIINYGN